MVAARFGAITSQDRDPCPSAREGVNGRRLIVNLEKPLQITWLVLIGLMVLTETLYKRTKPPSRSRYVRKSLTPLTPLTLGGPC